MNEMGRRAAKRQIEESNREIEEWLNGPNGEQQSQIDYLERPYGDETEGYDHDELVDDGE